MRLSFITIKYKTNFLLMNTNFDRFKQILTGSCIYFQQGFCTIYILRWREEETISCHLKSYMWTNKLPRCFEISSLVSFTLDTCKPVIYLLEGVYTFTVNSRRLEISKRCENFFFHMQGSRRGEVISFSRQRRI